jgi:hypothetical protein
VRNYDLAELRGHLLSPRALRISDSLALVLSIYSALVYVLSWVWQVWPAVAGLYLVPVDLLIPVVAVAVVLRIFQGRGTDSPSWRGTPLWVKLLLFLLGPFVLVTYFQTVSYDPAPSRVVSENDLYFEDVQHEGLIPISEADYELARVRQVRFIASGLLAGAVGFLLVPAMLARSHPAGEERRALVED